jgi:hypothetical protein
VPGRQRPEPAQPLRASARRVLSRCGCGCACGRFDESDHGALRDFVAGFDFDFLDGAGDVAGHFHGCLIGFEREERLLFFDHVAGLDVDFDDIDAAEIADIWNFDFDETHVRPLLVGYGEREWKLARRTGHGLTREREPGQNHLCCPPKDALFGYFSLEDKEK